MRRIVIACVGLAMVGLALVCACQALAQAPGYPTIPGMETKPAGTTPAYLPTSPPLTPRGTRASRLPEEWKKQQEDPDMNRDLLVTQAAGPWLLFVHSYDEADGPSLARALALELRGPNYGLPAYVFNYGDDERKAELERARREVERRKEAMLKAGLTTDMPIRVPHMLIRVQCAVLVGGYKDNEAARRDLDRIKKLRPLDGRRFKLPDMIIVGPNRTGERASVNPFLKAFPVRNPAVKAEQVSRDIQDLATLRQLNATESYNLLKCRKPITLAVKQFQMPTVVETRGTPNGFLKKFGVGGSGEKKDAAKESAHNLASLLREGGWEAYVLHTRFSSIVTVGAYDSVDDPRIPVHQEALTKLNARLANIPNVDLTLFARAIPMPVPK